MGQGSGFGKVILFNEHFVVYNIPSIVCAISDHTSAEVTRHERDNDDDFQIFDDRPETPGYKTKKYDQQLKSVELILKKANIDTSRQTLHVRFAGNLLAASGVGASAASCAAFARALNAEFHFELDNNGINSLTYEGERAYHGSPSGVDNTAATYGGMIQFTKGEVPKFEHITTPAPLEIVMGNTGLVTNTTLAVKGVQERKTNDPEKYVLTFERARKLVPKARAALEVGDYQTIGNLMDENHELLQNIEVSCEELDKLVNLAKENGALGAKMTGSGLGGYMVALTPGKELQNTVASAIENKGFKVLKTTIGV